MHDGTTPFERARTAVSAGTPPADAAATVVALMTDDEKLWCLDGDAPTWAGLAYLQRGGYHGAPFHAARVDRVGFPGVSFSDGPRGVVIGNATCFPVAMARGASWDPELEARIGDAIGRELRAAGATLTGAVCVNLLRHPAWGRAQETYGEDPFHVGEMGAAFTRGLQQHVMATVKHFAVNSMENARFRVDVEVDDVALHEVYLAQFRRIIDEGVACVMSAYNQLNGTYCGDHGELLTRILRDEWGFEGIVISDWIFGIRDAAASLEAGLDIEMPYRMVRAEHLAGAIERGETSWATVDATVTRIVATRLRFDPVLDRPPPPSDVIGRADHVALAREASARGVVVLRNESIGGSAVLPIDRESTRSLAVIGALADRVNLGDGGSSDVYSLDNVTVLAGLTAALPEATVEFGDGTDLAAAARLAAGAQIAIVVVGYTSEHEGEFIGDTGVDLAHLFPDADDAELVATFDAEIAGLPPVVVPPHVPDRRDFGFARGGDRESVRLLVADVELIRAVAAANERTVVVIQAGSAVVCSEWDADVAAIVQPFYSGQQAGHGIADVLLGDVNPSARLPYTVPAAEADLPPFDRDADHVVYDGWHGWWRSDHLDLTPAYPFGFGLSYTTFELDEVTILTDGDEVVARGVVRNVGERDGADVIQLSVALPDTDAPSRLVGFARVDVVAGELAPFTIRSPLSALRRRDATTPGWLEPAGRHRFTVRRFATDPDAVSYDVDVL